MIKILFEFDFSGVVFEFVSGFVKEYLRERKDIICCVVMMFIDDGGEDGGEGGEGVFYVEFGCFV